MTVITRVVRLSFEEKNSLTFEEIFEATKHSIRSFEGCLHLELHKDINHPNVYYTVSEWRTADCLEAYRQSELFKITWAKSKVLFNAKGVAYSLAKIESL